MTRTLALVLSIAMAAPGCAARSRVLMSAAIPAAQTSRGGSTVSNADAWRSFLEKLPPGARVRITLVRGTRIRGTLLQVAGDTILVSPRTRVPEPVQTIALADLAAVDVETAPSVGKAVAIGILSGVAAFFGVLFIAFTTISD